MTRADNTFPNYARLDLRKDTPPRGWHEGARRCMTCKKDWPNLPEFSPSPCCNVRAGTVADATPSMAWDEAYTDLMNFRFDRIYDKWNDGMSDEELMWANSDDFSDEEISEGTQKLHAFIESFEKESAHGGI